MPPSPASKPLEDALRHDREMASTAFRYHRFIPLVFLLFLLISLMSFHPEDLDFFAGGLQGSTYPRNIFGAWGTKVSWFMLLVLGVGAYQFVFLCLLCLCRRLIWRKGLLASNWEYILSIPLNVFGVSLLFGALPDALPDLTDRLNLATIPGGLLGQFLSSPDRGIISQALNTTGCILIAIACLGFSLLVILLYDWRVPAQALWRILREQWGKYQEKRAAMRQAEAEAAARRQAEAAPSEPPAPAPVQSEVRFSGGGETAPAAGFRARRGQESIQADRQAQEAILGQQAAAPRNTVSFPAPAPARLQGELPLTEEEPPPPPAPAPARAPAPPVRRAPAVSHAPAPGKYRLPDPEDFFPRGKMEGLHPVSDEEMERNKQIIQTVLDNFAMDADVVNATAGPQVTLYEVQMGMGTSVTRLGARRQDISMALKATRNIRMLLPIPGKGVAGIEVPNQRPALVCAHELFTSDAWRNTRMSVPLMLGKNFQGHPLIMDLDQAPHLLIAGSTGSGKSGCMNLLIQSLLLRFTPDELHLVMVDPKMLEFAPYEKIPHLAAPIINEVSQVGALLNWVCVEMDKRYRQMRAVPNVRKLDEFNHRNLETSPAVDDDGDPLPDHLPHLVIIIDELAEITLQVKKDVELALSRLGGKARAAGIHMIVATQRPSREVFTGVIKSNFPYRIALKTSDSTNSRIILGTTGAEDLLGKGDMLYSTGGAELERIQCGWVENREIADVTAFWTAQGAPQYNESLMRALEPQEEDGEDVLGEEPGDAPFVPGSGDGGDDLIHQALQVLRQYKRPTISLLQRYLRIGYNKSASLMQELEDLGYVGPQPISGMREIYWDNFPSEEEPALPRRGGESPASSPSLSQEPEDGEEPATDFPEASMAQPGPSPEDAPLSYAQRRASSPDSPPGDEF
ncbi:MAG: DNA translocase FtsK 4TM domain-containing protein [Oligosphaeraceae bacterium]